MEKGQHQDKFSLVYKNITSLNQANSPVASFYNHELLYGKGLDP